MIVALFILLGLFLVGAHWALPWPLVVAGVVAVLVLVLPVCGAMLWYANQHPDTALMEGAEVLVHHHLNLATKAGEVTAELREPSIDESMPMLGAGGAEIPIDNDDPPALLKEGSANG